MILVTGGTGLIGGEVLRLLSQDGVAARALTRNPQKAKNLPGITWVAGDMAKPETLPAAFQGAETLFLVSSIAEDTVALQHNAIEAARDAGVKHIVKARRQSPSSRRPNTYTRRRSCNTFSKPIPGNEVRDYRAPVSQPIIVTPPFRRRHAPDINAARTWH
jgi:saccharopine dehydrogenase-like NADP-dependent oxidoreductase